MAAIRIGVRREDKNKWERRTPLIPSDVALLTEASPQEFIVQPSEIRIYPDADYAGSGAQIAEDLSGCHIVFGVKEMPINFLRDDTTYVCFSHVIKGQPENMPTLKKMMELKCNLIDYEKIADEHGRRLILFGWFSGIAGMIDTLWALGRRLKAEGVANPFEMLSQTYEYRSLDDLLDAASELGRRIKKVGLPASLCPFVCGFTGYGNVSAGAQEVFDLLPFEAVSPEQLGVTGGDKNKLYKVVFKEEHMAEKVSGQGGAFDLQDYYDYPENYRGVFEKYIPHMTVWMNCIYWDSSYPRLMTKAFAKKMYSAKKPPKLRVIGDISCDVDGGVECTVKATDPGAPVYLYDVNADEAVETFAGNGPLIMAVDNLPCELARESSAAFGSVLRKFIPAIVNADFSGSFENCVLPIPIKSAMILYRGELTPDYKYLERYL